MDRVYYIIAWVKMWGVYSIRIGHPGLYSVHQFSSSQFPQNSSKAKSVNRMVWGSLRNVVRPLARTVMTHTTQHFPTKLPPTYTTPALDFPSLLASIRSQPGQSLMSRWHEIHSLTETRLPKRRPGFKNRRKRASLKPPGPYAWVQYTPGEPILANRPNAGSIKRRNERKRIAQRKAFIKSEAKKRKVQVQEAKKKKNIKRVERKMAAVARDREWAQRLVELQQLEAEKAAKA